LPDFEDPTRLRQIDATSATARLPCLDVEIIHRRSPAGDAEQILINLRAVPSFEAFSRFIESANPFVFWTRVMQMAWFPWFAAAKAVLPPGLTLPKIRPETTSRSSHSPGELR
jgi:hypothetical protein